MAIALVIALVVVVATRGSLRRLAQLPVEGFGMLFAALAIQAGLALVHVPKSRVEDVGFGLLLLSYACLLGFCFANLRLRGIAIIAIGIGMNALVIALNQGMPADGPTRIDAHGNTVSTVATSVKHRPQRPGDLLTVLDDRILLPRPFHEILSFGDLVLALGLIDVCYWGSRRDERVRLSVFALPTPAEPPPPPSAPTPVPSPAASPVATSATSATSDALAAEEPEDETLDPFIEELDLREPAPDARPHDERPVALEAHLGVALDDETDAALWLATP